eukprot:gene6553-4725_t
MADKQRSPPPVRSEGNPFRSSKPSGVVRGDLKKKVNVGKEGETPKKYFQFDRDTKVYDPFSNLSNIQEDDREEGAVDATEMPATSDNSEASQFEEPTSAAEFLRQLAADSSDRPKTSRGKSHPSPDEFFNYIVPSPESNRRGGRSRMVIDHANSDIASKTTSVAATDGGSEQDDQTTSSNSEHPHIKWSDAKDEPAVSDNGDGPREEADTERHAISDNYLLGINLDGVSRDKQIALLGCWLFGSALRI